MVRGEAPLSMEEARSRQRVELFIHYQFYEGDTVTGCDLSHDWLEQRTTGGCYF